MTNISSSPLGLAQGESSVGTAVLLYLLGPVQLSVQFSSQSMSAEGRAD